jgi:hypothetical protein
MMKKVALVAFIVSLAISYFHWIGLIAGGIASALAGKNILRALLYGFLFGVTVWVIFLINMSYFGMLGKYMGMGIVLYLSLLTSILIPTLSASVRGLID